MDYLYVYLMVAVYVGVVLYHQDWKGIGKDFKFALGNPKLAFTRQYAAQELSLSAYTEYRKITEDPKPYNEVIDCQFVIYSDGSRVLVDNWGNPV